MDRCPPCRGYDDEIPGNDLPRVDGDARAAADDYDDLAVGGAFCSLKKKKKESLKRHIN